MLWFRETCDGILQLKFSWKVVEVCNQDLSAVISEFPNGIKLSPLGSSFFNHQEHLSFRLVS